MRGRRSEPPPRARRASLKRDWTGSPAPDSPLPPEPPLTVREAVRLAEAVLDEAGVEECVADARLLLAHALKASPTWVFAHETDPFPAGGTWLAFRELVARRARREPLQHLVGEQEFFGLRFKVSPHVLIPRPETELVVERLIAALVDVARPRLADVGTGSGCIAVAACLEIPFSRVVACDVSPEALAVARANARDLGVDDRITFVEGSLGEPLLPHAPFHAVAANLPYVTTDECARLEPEVRDHEPLLALDGGADGLDLVRELVAQAPSLLVPGGTLVLEVGHRHGDEVAALLTRAGFVDVVVHPDLAGIGRVVEGRRPE